MKSKRILSVLGQVDEKYIEEAVPAEHTKKRFFYFWRGHRVAACICAILLAGTVCFSTVFAASATFRETVRSIFYPLYTTEEIHEIEEGHRTGSFDIDDTLLTFLEKFNREHMEAGISVQEDSGFHYTLLTSQNDEVKAIVDCDNSDAKLLVTMKRKPYEETTGLWQVVSYQVIDQNTAETMESNLQGYTGS